MGLKSFCHECSANIVAGVKTRFSWSWRWTPQLKVNWCGTMARRWVCDRCLLCECICSQLFAAELNSYSHLQLVPSLKCADSIENGFYNEITFAADQVWMKWMSIVLLATNNSCWRNFYAVGVDCRVVWLRQYCTLTTSMTWCWTHCGLWGSTRVPRRSPSMVSRLSSSIALTSRYSIRWLLI